MTNPLSDEMIAEMCAAYENEVEHDAVHPEPKAMRAAAKVIESALAVDKRYTSEIIDLIWAANNARAELRAAVARKHPLVKAKEGQRDAIQYIDQALAAFSDTAIKGKSHE